MKAQYIRVLPRDLFNEAKLSKCMGMLTLLIHDELAPNGLKFYYDGEPFQFSLLLAGDLVIDNITIHINNQPLLFKTTYNSKSDYPFYLGYDDCDYQVFDEDGSLSEDFLDITKEIQKLTRPKKRKTTKRSQPTANSY